MMAKKKKTKRKDKKPGATLAAEQILKTKKEAARYIHRSVRTIGYWVASGMPRTEEGYYIKSVLEIWRENEGRKLSEVKKRKVESEADFKDIKTKLAQLELDERLGELDKRIEEKTIPKILAVKRALIGQGRKLAPRLSAITNPRKIQKIIDDENRSVIEGFAR